jgi:hypothetical protein
MNYRHFIIGGVLGLFGLIALLVISNFSGGPSDSEFVFKGPAAQFKAEELAMMVRQAGPTAANQLKDKGLELTGMVLELDKPAVILEEEGVWCFFPESAWPKIEKRVAPGDMVVIRGLCMGLDPNRRTPTLLLKGCTLVHHERNPHGGIPGMPHP